MSKFQGTIYLLHFSQPFGHATHYLGWTTDLDARLASHGTSKGARLLQVVAAAGITWTCVRTWQGDRNLERRLKNRGGHARLCPCCRFKSKSQTPAKATGGGLVAA